MNFKSCRHRRTDHHWHPDQAQLRAAERDRLWIWAIRQEGSDCFSPDKHVYRHVLFPWQQQHVFVSTGLFQDLLSALKTVLSGSLEALMLGLMKSTAQYDASELKASMKVPDCPWPIRGLWHVAEWSVKLVTFMFPGARNWRGDPHRDRLLQKQRWNAGDQEGLQRK